MDGPQNGAHAKKNFRLFYFEPIRNSDFPPRKSKKCCSFSFWIRIQWFGRIFFWWCNDPPWGTLVAVDEFFLWGRGGGGGGGGGSVSPPLPWRRRSGLDDALIGCRNRSHLSVIVTRFTGFQQFWCVIMGFYWVLLSFTGFYWVLQLLPSFTGFCMILFGLIEFYWDLSGFTGFYWVLLVLNGCYRT